MKKRDKTVKVRITEEDYLRLKANADTFGCSMSELVRRKAVNGEGAVPPVIIDSTETRRILGNLQRVGGNLNQAVYNMNRYGVAQQDANHLMNEVIPDLAQCAKDLRTLVRDIRKGKYSRPWSLSDEAGRKRTDDQ